MTILKAVLHFFERHGFCFHGFNWGPYCPEEWNSTSPCSHHDLKTCSCYQK